VTTLSDQSTKVILQYVLHHTEIPELELEEHVTSPITSSTQSLEAGIKRI
jgi:hypothetical protein